MACSEFRSPFLHGLQRSPQGLRLESLFWAPTTDELLEPVAVGSDEVEDAAAELARSVQIVSPLPDHLCTQNPRFLGLLGIDGAQPGHRFVQNSPKWATQY
jgi:hypothetical protein